MDQPSRRAIRTSCVGELLESKQSDEEGEECITKTTASENRRTKSKGGIKKFVVTDEWARIKAFCLD